MVVVKLHLLVNLLKLNFKVQKMMLKLLYLNQKKNIKGLCLVDLELGGFDFGQNCIYGKVLN